MTSNANRTVWRCRWQRCGQTFPDKEAWEVHEYEHREDVQYTPTPAALRAHRRANPLDVPVPKARTELESDSPVAQQPDSARRSLTRTLSDMNISPNPSQASFALLSQAARQSQSIGGVSTPFDSLFDGTPGRSRSTTPQPRAGPSTQREQPEMQTPQRDHAPVSSPTSVKSRQSFRALDEDSPEPDLDELYDERLGESPSHDQVWRGMAPVPQLTPAKRPRYEYDLDADVEIGAEHVPIPSSPAPSGSGAGAGPSNGALLHAYANNPRMSRKKAKTKDPMASLFLPPDKKRLSTFGPAPTSRAVPTASSSSSSREPPRRNSGAASQAPLRRPRSDEDDEDSDGPRAPTRGGHRRGLSASTQGSTLHSNAASPHPQPPPSSSHPRVQPYRHRSPNTIRAEALMAPPPLAQSGQVGRNLLETRGSSYTGGTRYAIGDDREEGVSWIRELATQPPPSSFPE